MGIKEHSEERNENFSLQSFLKLLQSLCAQIIYYDKEML
jgi:hypothetical protein